MTMTGIQSALVINKEHPLEEVIAYKNKDIDKIGRPQHRAR